MTQTVQWSPLFGAERRERVMSVLTDVTALLIHQVQQLELADPAYSKHNILRLRSSLMAGSVGAAIYFDYLGRVLLDDQAIAMSRSLIRRALRALPRLNTGWSLSGGVVGVAWVERYLARDGVAPSPAFPIAAETGVRQLLSRPTWNAHLGLLDGLVGMGSYGFERLADGAGKEILEGAVAHLRSHQAALPGDCWWSTPPELAPAYLRGTLKDRYLDLGVAHGFGGIIAFLSRASQLDIQAAPDLFSASADGLCTELEGMTAGGLLPRFHSDEIDLEPTPPGWCYGNPGVAAVLLAAAQDTVHQSLEIAAVTLAKAAIPQIDAELGGLDASFCHGSSGIGHLYNRMYHATGEPSFRMCAERAYSDAISRGVDGLAPSRGIGQHLEYDVGILEGLSGLGLSLLASISDVDPEWDRLLMISSNRARDEEV